MQSPHTHAQTSSLLPIHLQRFFSKTLAGAVCRLEAIFSNDQVSGTEPVDGKAFQSLLHYGGVILKASRYLPKNKLGDTAVSALFSRSITLSIKADTVSEPTTLLDILRIRYLLAYMGGDIDSCDKIGPVIDVFKKQNVCWTSMDPKTGKQTHPPECHTQQYLWLLVDLWHGMQDREALTRLRMYLDNTLEQTRYDRLCKAYHLAGFFSVSGGNHLSVAEDIVLQNLFHSNDLKSALAAKPWLLFEQICLFLCISPNQSIFKFVLNLFKKQIESTLAPHHGALAPPERPEELLELTNALSLFWAATEQENSATVDASASNGRFSLTTENTARNTGGIVFPTNSKTRQFSITTYITNQIIPEALYITADRNWSRRHRQGAERSEKPFSMGAGAVLTETLPANPGQQHQFIIVPNTFTALIKLALQNRRAYRGKVIGITGSVGKTSTATMLHDILMPFAATYQNIARFNHEAGVPKSVANIPGESRYAIIEMGMGRPLSILPKTVLARPHIGVVVDIQHDHMEFHDTIGSIIETKLDIADGLEPGGTLILNRNSRYFSHMLGCATERRIDRIITFGEHADADIWAKTITLHSDFSDLDIEIRGRTYQYRLGLPGKHMALNSLAVCGVLLALDLDLNNAVDLFRSLRPAEGRNERFEAVLDNGRIVKVIDDSFNANPASMRSSFHVLALCQPTGAGRRIMVIGDMGELGAGTKKFHEDLAEPILNAGIDMVFSIGTYTRHLNTKLGGHIACYHFETTEQLQNKLCAVLRDGDVISFKGSARTDEVKKIVTILRRCSLDKRGEKK